MAKFSGNPFWKTAGVLLEFRRSLLIALVGLLVSAGCFGAGLGMLLPVFELLLHQQKNLRELVLEKLASASSPAWQVEWANRLASIIPQDRFHAFVFVLLVIAVLSIFGSTGRYIHEYIAITVSSRGALIWRKRAYRRIIQAPMSVIHEGGTSDRMSRLMGDTGTLSGGYQIIIGRTLQDIAKGIAAFGMAIFLNWELTLYAAVIAPLLAVLLRKFGKRIRRAFGSALIQQGRMLSALRESLGGLAVVKVHSAEGYERRRFAEVNQAIFNQEMKARRTKALSSPLIETLTQMAVMVVASIAAWRIFKGGIPASDLFAVLASLAAAASSFRPVTNSFNQIKEAEAAAARVLEVLQLPQEPGMDPGDSKRPNLPVHQQSVRFDQVVYCYRSDAPPAVDGVTLEVKFGQTVAIVGGNGSGKTTLLNLLPRLLTPTSGRVWIDGHEIEPYSLKSLRKQIAVVTQQSVLFQGTIADNIAYGRRHVSRDRIVAAAKAAFADEFIVALPQGYDTKLGEEGSGLSGGQKQRICIARAILRQPAILILDEATSQIDADSEAKITQALAQFRLGRTTFVIAHRLSTVVDADLIVVMDRGRIVDQGTHIQLLNRCEIYQTLTRSQMLTAPGALTAR